MGGVRNNEYQLSITVPPKSSGSIKAAYRDACLIAGVLNSNISIVEEDDALVACYARKLQTIRPVDREALNEKSVLIIEMAHTHSTAVIVSISSDGVPVKRNCEVGFYIIYIYIYIYLYLY